MVLVFLASFAVASLLGPDTALACDACDVLTVADCDSGQCGLGDCYNPVGANTCACYAPSGPVPGPCETGNCGRTTWFFTDQGDFEVPDPCTSNKNCVLFGCCDKVEYTANFECDGIWGSVPVIICCDN